MFKNFTLDSYETNNLVRDSYGSRSDDHIEDNLINGYLDYVRCYEKALTQKEFGAYLIVTGKQYIFAKCCDEGTQSHLLSVTKTFLELEGKNSDISVIDSSKIYSKYSKKFLIFDIEIRKDDINRKKEKIIRLNLNSPKISPEEYKLFKMFYDEYKEVIDYCKFKYSVWDKKTGSIIQVKNMKMLKNYLKSVTDVNIKPNTLEDGEKIVGVPIDKEELEVILKKRV